MNVEQWIISDEWLMVNDEWLEIHECVIYMIKPVSNPYRTDFMDLRIHDMDYGFTIWIYGSTDFMDFE